jgi:hypothetical protein
MKNKISTAIVFVPIDPRTGDFETELRKMVETKRNETNAQNKLPLPQESAPEWTWFIDNPRPNQPKQ